MSNLLSGVSLIVGLFAVVRSTLGRRATNRMPIVELVRDRFSNLQFNAILIGALIGTIVILGPFGLFTSLGWVQLQPPGSIIGNSLVLSSATILIKLTWAAIEELIFRGAILPQISRLTNGLIGLAASSLLFGWGHLERSGTRTPDMLSLLVFTLDGVGFGLAYLATKSLWLPTIWHTAKNIWIWLLFSESTLQLTPGLFRASYAGPSLWVGASGQAGLIDVITSALVAVILAAVYRRQILHGLAWVRNQ